MLGAGGRFEHVNLPPKYGPGSHSSTVPKGLRFSKTHIAVLQEQGMFCLHILSSSLMQ